MEQKDDMVRVSVEESNGGGPEAQRYNNFNINCYLGDHRPQRMYYTRDGTPFECLNIGVSSGLKNERPPQNHTSKSAHLTPKQARDLRRRERKGDQVSYALPEHVFVAINEVQGAELKWDSIFPYFQEDVPDISIDEFKVFESRDRFRSCFFGPGKSYVNLHDKFPLATVRSVFDIKDLLRMQNVLDIDGRLFFLMPAITEHLAVRQDRYELCEVDFARHRIVFYSQSNIRDARNTLAFYAECMWNQFVFPAQDKEWRVGLFAMNEASLTNFVLILEIRMRDLKLDMDDLSLVEEKESRASNLLRRLQAT